MLGSPGALLVPAGGPRLLLEPNYMSSIFFSNYVFVSYPLEEGMATKYNSVAHTALPHFKGFLDSSLV